MLDDTLPSKYVGVRDQCDKPVTGRLKICFCNDGRKTYLAHLHQVQPLRALFPKDSTTEKMAVIINMAGGVVGGDCHYTDIECGPNTTATVTGQAAEKIYRSSGAVSQLAQRITVAPGSWFELLPQGTIFFDGCRVQRKNRIDVSPRGKCLIGEIMTFGRIAMGENLRNGSVRDDWEIYRDNKLQWADFFCINDGMEQLFQRASGFNNASAMGICLYSADDAPDFLDVTRTLLSEQDSNGRDTRTGVSAFKNLLVIRWLSRDPADLRHNLGAFWSAFRSIVGGQKSSLPSIWNI